MVNCMLPTGLLLFMFSKEMANSTMFVYVRDGSVCWIWG
jgi:hypothetical protein